jgi:hypothetical protein
MAKYPLEYGSMDHLSLEQRALRALRDCRVVRAKLSHPVFPNLVTRGFVEGRHVAESVAPFSANAHRDYRLTELGIAAAARLPRFPGDISYVRR